MIKYGFKIEDGKIYDTHIKSYSKGKKIIGENIIYFMKPIGHKRLYLFEALLDKYDIDTVFEILNFNKYLKKDRKSEKLVKTGKLHYYANTSMIYNYPPIYLTQKRYYIYKTIQLLKKRID